MSTAPPPPGWPAWLVDSLGRPAEERRPWSSGLANAYIALFLLIAYYDQLAPRTLASGGLGWSIAGAAVAGLLGFALLYYVPALWGVRSRQPLSVVASRTFGAGAAPWLPGLLNAGAQVAWFAALLALSSDVALRSLVTLRLLDLGEVTNSVAFAGLTLRSPLVLLVTLGWAFTAAGLGIWLVRLITAVLKAYAIFPALAIGLAMLWALPGLGGFRTLAIDPMTAEPVGSGGPLAFAMMIQLVFGFFASSGLAGADWGAVSRSARDVRIGGLVSVAFASSILATIPLLTIAGTLGRGPLPPALAMALDDQERLETAYARGETGPALEEARRAVLGARGESFRYTLAIEQGIGGTPGGIMLMVLALPLLGPTCYAPYLFGFRMVAIAPRIPRWIWSLVAAALAWPLVATGLVDDLGRLFGILGALIAPVVGAMAADYVGSRGQWPGPRPGWNLAGCFAWALGVVVGLLPEIGDALESETLRRLQPASVLAFATAFTAYMILARLGLEPAETRVEAQGTGSGT